MYNLSSCKYSAKKLDLKSRPFSSMNIGLERNELWLKMKISCMQIYTFLTLGSSKNNADFRRMVETHGAKPVVSSEIRKHLRKSRSVFTQT